MKFPDLDNHPYIQEVQSLNKKFPVRMEFHKAMEPLLLKMGKDKDFLKTVLKRNFTDEGYLGFEYSLYNVPFLYVHETDDYNLKIHMFPPHPDKKDGIAAHCIHHHNNYILTTNAMHGSGYESILFEKNAPVDQETGIANLKINKHFHQKDWNPSRIESWEPHIVFIPDELSSTLLIWTPDKIRATDKLRNNPVIKPFKKILAKTINALGLASNFGIAEGGKKFQFYVKDDTFIGIEEDDYFAPTRAAKGRKVNEFSMQQVFAVIQRMGLVDKEFFKELKNNSKTPEYYHQYIDMLLNDRVIPDVSHPTEINIPNRSYTREDIFSADKKQVLAGN
ncbi:MAG: hypothetical protein ACI8XB_002437 [Patiriisocius sp.]|jgi:hypothetical protein